MCESFNVKSVFVTSAYPVVSVDRASTALHIARHASRIARPEPDLDKLVVALHSVPTAAVLVEGGAVAVGRACSLDTAAVITLAIIISSSTSHRPTTSRHGAARVGVESDLVGTLVVDALNL